MAPAHKMPERKLGIMARLFGVRVDDDAEQRDDDELAAARAAKVAADELEKRTQQRIDSARRTNDTRVRKVSNTSDSMATVFLPMNGKSIAELAADEREANAD